MSKISRKNCFSFEVWLHGVHVLMDNCRVPEDQAKFFTTTVLNAVMMQHNINETCHLCAELSRRHTAKCDGGHSVMIAKSFADDSDRADTLVLTSKGPVVRSAENRFMTSNISKKTKITRILLVLLQILFKNYRQLMIRIPLNLMLLILLVRICENNIILDIKK